MELIVADSATGVLSTEGLRRVTMVKLAQRKVVLA